MAVSILTGTLYAQRDVPLRFFSLQRVNGSFSLEGNYRKQDTQLKGGLRDELESSLFLGKLELNTRSYMFHPNLVSIELGGEYNPATQRDRYLVIPDRSEINTAEKINSRVAFFAGKPINFSLFGSFNHSFTNREFTTNVEMYRTGFGINFAFRNDILPFRLMYNNQKWDQEELQTGRKYPQLLYPEGALQGRQLLQVVNTHHEVVARSIQQFLAECDVGGSNGRCRLADCVERVASG